MYETNDFKKGLKILIDGDPYTIVDFQHVKPGKGNQFTRTKLKNIITGSNLDRTIKSGEKFEIPDIDYVEMGFLYKDEAGFNFMNQSSYEQMCLTEELLGESALYLIDNMTVKVCLYNDRAIAIELPNTVILRVAQTDPGLKGNTVSNTTKPATLETGLVVQVPLYMNADDYVKVDTRSAEYLERVAKPQ